MKNREDDLWEKAGKSLSMMGVLAINEVVDWWEILDYCSYIFAANVVRGLTEFDWENPAVADHLRT